jgi:hypothetical protein
VPRNIVDRKIVLRDLKPSDLERFDGVIHRAGDDPLGDLNLTWIEEIFRFKTRRDRMPSPVPTKSLPLSAQSKIS